MKTRMFLILLLGFNLAFGSETLIKSEPNQGKVEFEAIGKPSMLKIKGAGEGAVSDLKVVDGQLNGVIKFKLDSLKTGIDMRDEHMKNKYLQVKENPEATLVFKDFKLPVGWSVKSAVLKDSSFKGILKLHGIEREVTGNFSIESNKLNGSAKFEVKLSDFKIDIPEYLGVKVADIVKVNVNFEKMTATDIASSTAPAAVKK